MPLNIILTVLIYPYWNVNYISQQRTLSSSSSFNLSILECKYKVTGVTVSSSTSFNLSILECKYTYVGVLQMAPWRFNLSILECK